MDKMSDFMPPPPERLPGTKVSVRSILNVPIIITGFSIMRSHYDDRKTGGKLPLTTIQFRYPGREGLYVALTSSLILRDTLLSYDAGRDKTKPMECESTIIQSGNALVFKRD